MNYPKEFKKVLLAKSHAILGKNGVTNEYINHISKLLKKYKIIKIKALKSIATKSNIKELAEQIKNATSSYLLDVRGFKIILSQYPIKKNQ